MSSLPSDSTVLQVGLLFVFLGIAIISDLFMEAIEVITSAEATARRTLPSGRLVEWRYQVRLGLGLGLGLGLPTALCSRCPVYSAAAPVTAQCHARHCPVWPRWPPYQAEPG
jgi:hypothetical protein